MATVMTEDEERDYMRRRQKPEDVLDSASLNALVDSTSLPDVSRLRRREDLSHLVEPLVREPRVSVNIGEVQELGRTPMDAPGAVASGPVGGSPRAMVAEAMKGAMSSKPTAGPALPSGPTMPTRSMELSPEQQEQVMAEARKRAEKMGLFDSWGRNLSSAADLIAGRKAAPLSTDSSRQRSELMGDAEDRVSRAKQYAAERMGLAEKAEAKARDQERYDTSQKRLAEQDRLAAEDTSYGRTRQGELDALNKQRTEAELARIKAETARANRRNMGPGGGVGMSEEAMLKLQKLRQDVEKSRQGITGEDPSKVRAAEVSSEKLKGLIGRLRGLHKQHGPTMTGEVGSQMGQLQTAIQMEAKNIAGFGALSGPDLELMKRLAGTDPTSLWTNTLGVDNTQTSLDELEKWTENAADSARRVYGSKAPAARAGMPTERGPVSLEQPPKAGPTPTGRTKTDGKGVVWEEMSDGSARRRG